MKTSEITKQQGFSLLEILIAFSILALSLGILLRIFSGGVNTAMVAEDYTIAVQIAESLIAKTGSEVPLKDHQSSGVENKKYQWSLTVSPYFLSNESIDPKNVAAQLYKVNVTVVWGNGESDGRQIQLTTLKLAAKDNAAS
ncbi:prepilin-type N-terminal cleavage/methylation domain-containing protein [Methyloglobulus sp.]|uniref:type IV pilus modification PilV family protein n=1 Tax=Methyloglobulus sp. TaxID=2518622 RepID=UPI0039892BC6